MTESSEQAHFDQRAQTRAAAAQPTTAEDYYAKENAQTLIDEEKVYIAAHRARDGGDDWYGLALSGGGIRSSIFCLGALQALAAKNVMPSFDYASSVSGGGYISAALQWLWRRYPATGTGKDSFPFGASRDYRCGNDDKDAQLAYLRTHGQYLIPDERLSIWSLTAVVIRTLFLNLAVWLPIGAAAYVLAILLFRLMEYIPGIDQFPNLLSFVMASRWGGECPGDAIGICKGVSDTIIANTVNQAYTIPGANNVCTAAINAVAKTTRPGCDWKLEFFFEASLLLGLLLMAGFAIWAIVFSLDTKISARQEQNPHPPTRWRFIAAAVLGAAVFAALINYLIFVKGLSVSDPYILGLFLLLLGAVVIFAILFVLQKRVRSVSANYNGRRTFEVWAGRWLPWITIIMALGTVPVIPYLFINQAGFAAKIGAGALSLVSGLYAAVFGHRAQTDQTAPGDVSRWMLMFASAIFIYSIAVVAYVIAQFWFAPDVLITSSMKQNLVRAGISVWAVLAIILMLRTNINFVGLHRFYRDRLMEAFMPDPSAVSRNEVDFSPDADHLALTDLWPPTPSDDGQPRSLPYPIINANAILMNDTNRLLAWRGGDNFILTPLFVGCAATGWERTSKHAAKHGPLSLPSAMAASGAAINANAAYVGAGVTRDRLVSIVLMLLNLRLGMWIARPDERPATGEILEPNLWNPGFRYGLTRTGYTSQSSFVELSDGGHFDNSGIYELARRKCAVIVAIDGEEDPSMALPALYAVAQRVREDFEATIELDGVLNDLVPEKGKGYPEGVSFVTRPYFVAPIAYKNGTKGVLIYVKLSLAQGLGFDALGYRAQHADFPHQPTTDQFFVPEQVEAYRNVGFVNMEKAINELSLLPGPVNIDAVLQAYRNRAKARHPRSQWQRPPRLRPRRRIP